MAVSIPVIVWNSGPFVDPVEYERSYAFDVVESVESLFELIRQAI